MTAAMDAVQPDDRIYIAGHSGLLGSALWRRFEAQGNTHLFGKSSSELDLRDRTATAGYLAEIRPDIIILAAARVGGIAANAHHPIEYMSDNLRIQFSVMDAARDLGIDRLVFVGSAAAYPRGATNPIPEEAMMSGTLEEAHAGYAMAKLCGVQYVISMRKQGARWSALMPTNIYGPEDNFHAEWSHVVPALLRKFHHAVETGAPEVVIWGSGQARREFLHSDDLATACLRVLESNPSSPAINVGVGDDVTIRELAEMIAEAAGFTGELVFDSSRPDGMPQRKLDSSRLRALGWTPEVDLRTGLKDTYAWLAEHWPDVRN